MEDIQSLVLVNLVLSKLLVEMELLVVFHVKNKLMARQKWIVIMNLELKILERVLNFLKLFLILFFQILV
jgi:hypothetical protein